MGYDIEISPHEGFYKIDFRTLGSRVFSFVTDSFEGFLAVVGKQIADLRQSGENVYVYLREPMPDILFSEEERRMQRKSLIDTIKRALETPF